MSGETSDLNVEGKGLYIGPAGWAYDDWRGVVYPAGSARVDPVTYLSRYFNVLEVNVSFYRPVTARMSASWARRVEGAARFRFTFKLYQRFTHQRSEPYTRSDVEEFTAGLAPIVGHGLFGALLAQFPWSFRFNDEAIEYLERIRSDFAELPIAVEVRHRSWEHPEALERLAELGLSLCTIDQPRLRSCIRPVEVATGPIAYVRLHGRNAENWFAEDIETYQRYDYLYSEAELAEWVPRIRRLAETVDEIFVIANNHYRGQAPANALQLRHLLTGEPVDVPDPMFEHFPALARIARNRPPRRQHQGTLF